MSENPFIRLALLVEEWKRREREDLVFASPHMPEPALDEELVPGITAHVTADSVTLHPSGR